MTYNIILEDVVQVDEYEFKIYVILVDSNRT